MVDCYWLREVFRPARQVQPAGHNGGYTNKTAGKTMLTGCYNYCKTTY